MQLTYDQNDLDRMNPELLASLMEFTFGGPHHKWAPQPAPAPSAPSARSARDAEGDAEPAPDAASVEGGGGGWTKAAVDLNDGEVDRLLRRVHPKTLAFVKAVVEAGGRVRTRDLYAELGYRSPMAARGVLSGLTKRVRRIKGRRARLFGWVSLGEGSHGILHLTPTTQASLERYFDLV